LENFYFWSQIWSVGSRNGSCGRCDGQQEQLELAVWKKTGSKTLADKRELFFFVGFDCAAAAAAASGKKLDK
jgi:hypothetical protein